MTLAVNIAQSGSNNVTFRNRIINGAMVIAQRGTGTTTTAFLNQVDQFQVATNAMTFTFGQSSTAPTGFIKSALVTNTSAVTPSGTNYYSIRNAIEGLNVADLAWGTSNAKTITLSFWVYSSLTGTFGGVIANGAFSYFYPYSYTISSANTWEQKTINITGPTAGTWSTDNSVGIYTEWSLGCGSTYLGTAGSWGTTRYQGVTGQVQLSATNNATFYITGVQLEAGTTASPFEYRQYGTELGLCYRYYYRIKPSGAANPFQGAGIAYTTSKIRFNIPYPVTMRTAPTALEQSGTAGDYSQLQTSWVINSAVPAHDNTSTTATNVTFTSSAGFTTGYGAIARDETGNAYLGWSAEL